MTNAPNWQQAFHAPKWTFGAWDAKTGECQTAFRISTEAEYVSRLDSFCRLWVEERGFCELLTVNPSRAHGRA